MERLTKNRQTSETLLLPKDEPIEFPSCDGVVDLVTDNEGLTATIEAGVKKLAIASKRKRFRVSRSGKRVNARQRAATGETADLPSAQPGEPTADSSVRAPSTSNGMGDLDSRASENGNPDGNGLLETGSSASGGAPVSKKKKRSGKRSAGALTPPKAEPKRAKLFSDVSKDALKARILYKNSSKGAVTVDVFNRLVGHVFELIDKLSSTDELPSFVRTGFLDNHPFIHCSNQFTWDWLDKILKEDCVKLGIGQLTMEAWEIKIPRKGVSVLVPSFKGERLSRELLFERLTKYNPGLCVKRWIVCHMNDTDDYAKLVVLKVDFPSCDLLKDRNYNLLYPLGLAKFRMR
jgi:hypothetical protein